MSRLVFSRKPARFAAARLAGAFMPGRGATVGPLSLEPDEALPLPTPEWLRLRPRLAGICGSDLALVDGTASAYFDPLVSYPFVPGHEVVADVVDQPGRRVVVIPVLHCAIRGITPVCHECAAGRTNRCERVAFGHLEPGLQTGFCESTGGGWSTEMVAHPLQLVDVPDDLSDEAAMMIEPTACAVHAAKQYDGNETAIIGAGTVGLLTLAAIRATRDVTGPIIVTARYPDQKRLAKALGADVVCSSDELPRWVRSSTSSLMTGDQLTCGCHRVFDCVGSSDSIQQALRVVAPGGEVDMVGMPGNVSLELTTLWHRETAIRGVYAYTRADFDTAIDVVRRLDLGRLVSATYPLKDFHDAIAHAASAGRRGAVKVAFDMRENM
ncbi:MAG: zinc-binding dehydrogenase [Ilumatobacteraceae bacterium]|nr:zinc-binding dehydrogenase [Ilumatobacteraceae bacterium]